MTNTTPKKVEIKRNRKAILRLASFIENGRYNFDMAIDVANLRCGTAGCIAGHAAVLWPSVRAPRGAKAFTWSSGAVGLKLGIDAQQQHDLFYRAPDATGRQTYLEVVDRQMAVRTLRRFARTGKIEFREKDRASQPKGETDAG